MMRLVKYLGLVGILASLGLFAGACSSEDSGPVELQMIDAFPTVLDISQGTLFFIDEVARISGGDVTVNRVGGSEVTHSLEQFAPTRDGVYDMIATVGAYHTDHTKLGLGENVAANYTRIADNYGVRVQCGLYDALEAVYKPLGMQFVGSLAGGWGARLWTVDPIRTLDDMNGKHLRAATIYQPFLHAYGASTTPLQFSEIYPALEKGVIKGLYWGGAGALSGKWDEVIKYQYPDSLAGGGGVSILVNQAKWDSMSESQQKAVSDAVKSAAVFQTENMNAVEAKEVATLAERGIETINWDASMKKTWSDDHYNKIIADYIVAPNPTLGEPLAKAIRCVNDIVLPDRN
jgi:TRAP-type C4-dicarboxylate transport system substrate-binding protein